MLIVIVIVSIVGQGGTGIFKGSIFAAVKWEMAACRSMLTIIVIVIIVGQGGTGIFKGKEDSEGCIRRHCGYR